MRLKNKGTSDAAQRIASILDEVRQEADANARREMLRVFQQATNGSAPAVKRGPGRPRKTESVETAPVKRRVGRPRKNAATATATASAPKKNKAKRVLSEENRKKLAENLKKARAARAQNQKAKPATAKKRGPGRPRKTETEAPAATAPQA